MDIPHSKTGMKFFWALLLVASMFVDNALTPPSWIECRDVHPDEYLDLNIAIDKQAFKETADRLPVLYSPALSTHGVNRDLQDRRFSSVRSSIGEVPANPIEEFNTVLRM